MCQLHANNITVLGMGFKLVSTVHVNTQSDQNEYIVHVHVTVRARVLYPRCKLPSKKLTFLCFLLVFLFCMGQPNSRPNGHSATHYKPRRRRLGSLGYRFRVTPPPFGEVWERGRNRRTRTPDPDRTPDLPTPLCERRKTFVLGCGPIRKYSVCMRVCGRRSNAIVPRV